MSAGPYLSNGSGVLAARQFTPPELHENESGWHIEFNAFDPSIGKMRRKRIKVNRIKSIKARRKYAKEIIARLNDQLTHGWNPWIAQDAANLDLFEDALERYENYVEKMFEDGYFRKETYSGYKSNIKILREYIGKQRPIYYVYQFDRRFCSDFLDHVFIERDNCAQTRNNYLNFLKVFSGFLVDKGLLKERPTNGIAPISKRLYRKERTGIPAATLGKISEYLAKADPYFLFACYLLHYCFIRPVEMTRLRIKHFSLKDSTVTIPGGLSKNHETQTVSIPKKVLLYGVDLGVFSKPMGDFLFSADGLRPGDEEIDPKIFRDHWEKVRKALKLPKTMKFYSLKDSGITEMCRHMDTVRVKDQARHSSLATTTIYLEEAEVYREGDANIIQYDGFL